MTEQREKIQKLVDEKLPRWVHEKEKEDRSVEYQTNSAVSLNFQS